MNKLRKKILNIIYNAQAGHLNSSFSCLELIYASLSTLSKNKHYENFILSKGHAAVAYYVVLNHFRILTDKDLLNYCSDKSLLYGHPIRNIRKKILFTTGSLGNGIAAACGLSYAKKIKNINDKIICLVGDGECNEGIFWESLLLINKFNLDNLIIIIDDNLSSNYGSKLPNLEKITKGFANLKYKLVDGHNSDLLTQLLSKKYSSCLILHAKTKYGFGSSITLNNKKFHHPKLNIEEYKDIMISLK